MEQRTRNDHTSDLDALTPVEGLATALDALSESEHGPKYEPFVRAMCYSNENETPTSRMVSKPSVASDSVCCEHLLVSAATMPHWPAPLKLGYELLCCTP